MTLKIFLCLVMLFIGVQLEKVLSTTRSPTAQQVVQITKKDTVHGCTLEVSNSSDDMGHISINATITNAYDTINCKNSDMERIHIKYEIGYIQ